MSLALHSEQMEVQPHELRAVDRGDLLGPAGVVDELDFADVLSGVAVQNCPHVSHTSRLSGLILWIPQHFDDLPGQRLFDLPVSWDWLDHAGFGIAIPVMLAAVADEHAAEPFNHPDQVYPLHDTTNSSTLRMPGICPPAMSS